MKKILLTGAMLLALSFGAKAQNNIVTITSFEEAEPAAFSVGSDITDYPTYFGSFSSANVGAVDSGVIVISDEFASDGTQSIKFEAQSNGDDEVNYMITPTYDFSTLASAVYSINFDTQTDEISEDSSNLIYNLVSVDEATEEEIIIAKLQFDYSGAVYTWDPAEETEEASGYIEGPEFVAEEAYNVKIRFNLDSTISYVVNEEVVSTITPDAAALNGQYYLVLGTDDYTSSWFVDNLSVEVPTAGVKNTAISEFAVYPNPANNIISASSKDALVNAVTFTDLNGRTVKSSSFNGVNNAQVNISDLASGVYMMNISSDKGTTVKKIVKN
jgi:hypothetical protein